MTAIPLDLTDDDFMTALRSFVLAVLPDGVECFQGQANRVPEPVGPDFVVMTQTNRVRMSTNVDLWDKTAPDPDSVTIGQSTQVTVQLDIHGPNGSDYAQTIATLFRDDFGCQALDPTGRIAPLFASDGNQIPFINGESQYENRWVMSAVMQGSPSLSTPQDFAAIVTVTILPVIGG